MTPAAAPQRAVWVAGLFDVLRAAHVRQLQKVREQASGAPVVAIILPRPEALMDIADRARMAASLRMVDYVVITDAEELHGVFDRLGPVRVVRLEEPPIGALRDAG